MINILKQYCYLTQIAESASGSGSLAENEGCKSDCPYDCKTEWDFRVKDCNPSKLETCYRVDSTLKIECQGEVYHRNYFSNKLCKLVSEKYIFKL